MAQVLTGSDMVEIGRFGSALARHGRLTERLFSEAELDSHGRWAHPAPHLAARFAAKEAVVKLLSSGVGSWREIEILSRDNGRGARVELRGRARARAQELGIGAISVSMYHTDSMAGATAVAESGSAEGWCGEMGERAQTEFANGLDSVAARPRGFAADQVRELDRFTIFEVGVPGPVLMERAALGVTGLVASRWPNRHTLILCGRGNNGGDGLAAARQLQLMGHPVVCAVLADNEDQLTPDAGLNCGVALRMGVNLYMGSVPDYLWDETELVVDCLLGTGTTGELREPVTSVAEKINALGARGVPILAVDVPTGIDATSGAAAQGSVVADCTITFHAAKSGILAPPGSEAAGEVLVWDIGLAAFQEPPPDVRVVTAGDVGVPGRRADDHKYRAGFVAVVAGSRTYPGAAFLCSRAAAHCGAGYVKLFAPGGVVEELRVPLVEVVAEAVAEGDLLRDAERVLKALEDERISACAVGPGLGRDAATLECVRRVVADVGRPLVLDADGLIAFAGRAADLAGPHARVLTPHQGELAALLGVPVSEVARSALATARRGAVAAGQVVVLKGSSTVIASPEGETWVVTQAPPQLASAGTGDVLTGCIAALLAKGMTALDAAKAGVWLHAEAGLRLSRSSAAGILASDMFDILPHVIAERLIDRRPSWA